MPDVLLATMNMLFAQYQKIKGNNEYIPRYQDGSMETVIFITELFWIREVYWFLFSATEASKRTSQVYHQFYRNAAVQNARGYQQ